MGYHPIAFLILAAGLGGTRLGLPLSPRLAMNHQQEQSKSARSASSTCGASPDAATEGKLVLRDGTAVPLKFAHPISSSQVIAGETVDLAAVGEFHLGNFVVIAAGSPARATVVLAEPKRKTGRGGSLELRIDTIRLATGENAPLRMTEDVKSGDSKRVMAGGLIASFLGLYPASLLLTNVQGKDAVIAAGTEVTAYVNGDVCFDPSKLPAPAPALQTHDNLQQQDGSK
jgi:hypothetical protein